VSKIRYYTDEHVSKAVIRGLRQRGVNVLSVPEAQKLGATDEEHIAFAHAEGRVLFTQDEDFLKRLLQVWLTPVLFTLTNKHQSVTLFKVSR